MNTQEKAISIINTGINYYEQEVRDFILSVALRRNIKDNLNNLINSKRHTFSFTKNPYGRGNKAERRIYLEVFGDEQTARYGKFCKTCGILGLGTEGHTNYCPEKY